MSIQQNKEWKVIEHTVGLLEKCIAPTALITVDEWFPELVTGTRRQCDVVIRQGKPPRETLTIVEVQNRNRNVELGDYEGWCEKRRKLGAQHLICVSVRGFPKSIHEDAMLKGNTVRLMTLCEPSEVPDFVSFTTINSNMRILNTRQGKLVFNDTPTLSSEDLPLMSDKVFEHQTLGTKLSLFELADKLNDSIIHIQRKNINSERFKIRYILDFRTPNNKVWLHFEELRIPVEYAIVVDTVEQFSKRLPVQVLAYEQAGFDGELAWIVIARGEYEGKNYYYQFPYVIRNDKVVWTGRIASIKIPGLEYESQVFEISYRVDDFHQYS